MLRLWNLCKHYDGDVGVWFGDDRTKAMINGFTWVGWFSYRELIFVQVIRFVLTLTDNYFASV